MIIKFITRTEGNEVFVDYSCDKKLVSSQETTRPLSVIAAALNRIEQQPHIITSIVVDIIAIDSPRGDGMNKIPVCHMKINRRYQVTWYPADKTSRAIFADYCRYHNNLVGFSISERKLPQLEEYCRNKGVTLRTTEIASI